MPTRAAAALVAASLALVLLPASSGAAGWDPVPLPLSPQSDTSPQLGPIVETTDDGAAWVMWVEDPDQDNNSDVIVIRVGADGVPGERRVLTTTDPGYFGAIGMAALPGGDVRVAYTTELGAVLVERRLTPTTTGDAVELYDKATTDDGDVTDNGNVEPVSVRVLSAPGGASWVSFVRKNSGTPVVSARRIADDDAVGSLVALTQTAYEPAPAVDSSGRLIVALASGAQGRMVVVPVGTDGSVGGEVEIRASYGSPAASNTPEMGIDAAGIATVGWRLDVFGTGGRYIEARRVNTATDPMTPLGSGATAMDDDLPGSYVQYGPLFAVEPGGAAVMGWLETDSNQTSNDAMVRLLAGGAFADTGVVGARVRLDDPAPEAGVVADLVPGPSGIVTALYWTDNRVCGAPRIDTATGNIVSNDVIPAAGCAAVVGPASAANGLVATWTEFPTWQVTASRYVTDPPECSDGTAATVVAGESVTLPLPCTGWRPQREIVGSPARGTLGAPDQAAGTVTYTAGTEGGTDQVRFRAVNGAGASSERSIAITVNAPSVPPPPDTSDHTAPVLSGVSLKPKRLRLRKLRMPTLAFSLSEPATVNVTVQRLLNGRRKRGRCVTKPRPRRGPRCVKATMVKRLSSALPAGVASMKITLRRPVKPGRYRVTVSATDTAGNISKAVQVSLKITRR